MFYYSAHTYVTVSLPCAGWEESTVKWQDHCPSGAYAGCRRKTGDLLTYRLLPCDTDMVFILKGKSPKVTHVQTDACSRTQPQEEGL